MKVKLIKPKVKKVNYAQEDTTYSSAGGTVPSSSESKLTVNVPEEMTQVDSPVEEIAEKIAQKFMEALQQHKQTGQSVEIDLDEEEDSEWEEEESEAPEEAPKEEVEQSQENVSPMDKLKDMIENLLNDDREEETQKEEEEEQENEQEEDKEEEKKEESCSKEERAFLDSFYQLQEAGLLLGMVPTTSLIEDKIANFEIIPRIDKITETDILKNEEENQVSEVYGMFSNKIGEVMYNLAVLLKSKNLRK